MSGDVDPAAPSRLAYGLVTRTEEDLGWSGIDRNVFEAKGPSGRSTAPVAEAANAIACFRDRASVEASPDLAQSDGDDPSRSHADAAAVCPNVRAYRLGLLDTIAEAGSTASDVRLDHVGFADPSYCRCDRCTDAFAEAPQSAWDAWRVTTVMDFVQSARDRVPGRLSIAVHPDPYPGRLRERAGIEMTVLADLIDEIVVPLYDPSYQTTYWLETIAGGFAAAVPSEVEFGVELYAADVDLEPLLDAVGAVEVHVDTVYFGYGADNAIAAIRRRTAADTDGMVYGP